MSAGTYHGFHMEWIIAMKHALNGGILPPSVYADTEQQASRYEADVLALERFPKDNPEEEVPAGGPFDGGEGGVATLARATRPRLSVEREADPDAFYAIKRRTLALRHVSGDRLVALIELASPSNKDRRSSVERFIGKAVAALEAGVHVAVIDLFPPRRFDTPGGLVGQVAEAAGFAPLDLPETKPLCVGGFEADRPARLYAEPLAVGDVPPDLPLFLAPEFHVNVPLASTYAEAYAATPKRWRDVIEGGAKSGGGAI